MRRSPLPSGEKVRSVPVDEKPDPKKKKRVSLNAWREAKDLVWARRYRLGLGLMFVLVNRSTAMILPASTKLLIDEVIGKRRTDLLLWIALGAGGATIIQGITSFALTQILGIAAQRSINDLRRRIHRHIARLPTRFFDANKSGVLISRIINDAEGIRNLVGTGFVQLVGGFVTMIFALCILFYINWRLTLVTLTALIIFACIMMFGFSKLRPLFRQRSKVNADLTGRLAEFLGGIRVVKAYTAEKREEIVFARDAHKLFRIIAQSMAGISFMGAISTTLLGLVGVFMMIVGGREALAGRMTSGDIFMFCFYTALVVTPMIQISAIGTQITEAFAGLDRIHDLLTEVPEDEADPQLAPLDDVRGEIHFSDVWFEYNPGVPVLKDVSFEAPAGTTTALVGSSGSGKSTLISLIMAFNRPMKGRILVDGRDLSSVRLKDYRSHLGVVMQDNFLFDGTIAENISYGSVNATREEILEAARIAHCDEFVDKFEDKYDTVVGERGVKVSGGQRQRIAIARAILADPRILILDEATSSLDSESEAMIQDGLRALRRGRTTFVIAHRLSTIRNADQILVLENGEIVERGTHSELLAAEGRYRALYDKQYRWELDRFINPGEDFLPEPPKLEVPVASATGRPSL